MFSSGRETGEPGSFGVENRGSRADQGCRTENHGETSGRCEEDQTAKREPHTERKRIGHGSAVGVDADEWLQERGGELEDESD